MYKALLDTLEKAGIKLPSWILITIAIIICCALIVLISKKYIIPFIAKTVKLYQDVCSIDELRRVQNMAIKKSIETDNKLAGELNVINTKIDSVVNMFVQKQINDLRYEILDFGSAVMNGRKYEKEAYDHILEVYNNYEKILHENNMTNGRVTTTMEIINDSYKKKFSVQS